MLRISSSIFRATALAAAAIFVLMSLYSLLSHGSAALIRTPLSASSFGIAATNQSQSLALALEGKSRDDSTAGLACRLIPGAEDVLVVMRTGATEIEDKLPVHFNTTFQCYSDLLVFSDFGEQFLGLKVHDVLNLVDAKVKDTHEDFELYRRLQNEGRANILEEFGDPVTVDRDKKGHADHPGWRLDKWKFLPMMVETLRLHPDKLFYVFVETDSYLVWSNLLQWFEQLDPTKPLYAGSEVMMGRDMFAHGGSVFVMTKSAVELAAKTYVEQKDAWDHIVDVGWAGDAVLGKLLASAGAPLTPTWPMIQGGIPEKMNFADGKENKDLFCAPALSYHHLTPGEVARMWDFEQKWIQSRHGRPRKHSGWWPRRDRSGILLHGQVFTDFIWPNITSERSGWNNMGLQDADIVEGSEGMMFNECRHICVKDTECMQFAHDKDGCRILHNGQLGEAQDNMKSGWILPRIEDWIRQQNECQGWTVQTRDRGYRRALSISG